MQFERLRKNHRKQVIIGTIAICIVGGAITFATSRAFYRVDDSLDLAKGIVNYKPYDFKIMAMYKSDNNTNYTEITNMPSSGYVINEDKSYCTTDNKSQVKGKIRTESGKHYITGLSKSDKCYLYFDKKTSIDNASELLAKVQREAKTTAPTFSNIATTDEGVYAVEDGMYGGASYYWRGAATTNYVEFSGLCWRIVRINGDGSIRLIYDGTTCHANGISTTDSIAVSNVAYNALYNQSNYVGWTYEGQLQRPTNNITGTASNAKAQLESWYSGTITGTNAEKISEGKYCNDRNVGEAPSNWTSTYVTTWNINGTLFAYAGAKRLNEDYAPTVSCIVNDIYTLKAGFITADEIVLAGGNNEVNTSYYLYNGQSYWTMTPYSWSGSKANVFRMNWKGNIIVGEIYFTDYNLRPVINLKSDVAFSGGDGTLNNPYVVQ